MPETDASVDLYWLPLGAGDPVPCVRWNGLMFEALASRHAHRAAADLYHSALAVRSADHRYVIELAPAWGRRSVDRGVVGEGPVGSRWLGHSRYFRYEVRCWRDGILPDESRATAGPSRLTADEAQTKHLLALVPEFPRMTWGRDELAAGEMWNSNSLVSWLIARSGLDTEGVNMPAHGRAPGWTAGLVVAGRNFGFTSPM